MGISEQDLAFISALGTTPARVCDLGDQDLLCNNDAVFESLGFKAPRRGKSRDFWESIGADYLSIDIVGASKRFDLNSGSVPFWWRKFDLVTNCGNTEHVLNQLNCFKVIHDLTKVGGLMYHQLPVGGYSWHGFFLYSFKFFHTLAQSNAYEIVRTHAEAAPGSDDPPSAAPFDKCREAIKPRDSSLRIAMRKTSMRGFRIPIDAPL